MPNQTDSKPRPRDHIILTGGDGYIGRRVCELAIAAGYDVTVLARKQDRAPPGARQLKWSLGDPLPLQAVRHDFPARRQVLIHLAHDLRNLPSNMETEGELNVVGSRILFQSCRDAGLDRIVFVSSQSAREDAANTYGRVKWQIEQELDRRRDVAARLGLVYGGRHAAMYGTLSRLAAVSPILPMVEPWRLVQPIHLDEVCLGLLHLAQGDEVGWYGLASPQGIPFGAFLKELAHRLHGRRLRIIPLPLQLALLACDLAAVIPFGWAFGRERVLGLAGTRLMSNADHMHGLGIKIDSLVARLRREPASRKSVLAEANIMMRFVLRSKPRSALLRRYARAIARSDYPGPIPLGRIVRIAPMTLRILEPLRGNTPLARRLRLAAALAEASPEGQRALGGSSRPYRIAMLALDMAIEGLVMPLRAIASLRRGNGDR